jgi:hypothetical protein
MLEKVVEIIVHFVQISLANFDGRNVITHKNTFALHKFHQTIHRFQYGQNIWQVKDHVNIT